jgi:MFS family permease
VANDKTPNRDRGAPRDYGVVPGEERTQVFDEPDKTQPYIPLPPPLPPRPVPPNSSPSPTGTGAVETRSGRNPGSPPAETARLEAAWPGQTSKTRRESEAARVLRTVGEGTLATSHAIGKVGGVVGGRIRRVTRSGGAGESGLAHLIELHAVNGVGDLMITLALAQSVFFGVAPGQARGKVALYLVITMVPFVLLAPVIGPLLDRFGHGRRIAMAMTMAARLVLALVMARTVNGNANLALYPAAFGCLAASRAYGIARSAVIPRLLPPGTTLVKANSRTSMAGIAATFLFAPIAGLLVHLGPQYALMGAAVIFGFGAYLAIRLPSHVDSAEGEQKAQLKKRDRDLDPRLAETMPNLRLRSVGPAVVLALRANAAFRCFAGFLTIFLAFLVREHPFDGLKDLVALGMVAAAAAVGNAIGTALGSLLKTRAPEGVISAGLALTTGAVLAAGFFYSLATVLTVAAVAGLCQALAKLSLDALLQRDTLERVRTSAFARSETLLQLSWVIGGGAGIGMSFVGNGTLAFALASVGLLSVCLVTLKALSDLRFLPPNPAQEAGFGG